MAGCSSSRRGSRKARGADRRSDRCRQSASSRAAGRRPPATAVPSITRRAGFIESLGGELQVDEVTLRSTVVTGRSSRRGDSENRFAKRPRSRIQPRRPAPQDPEPGDLTLQFAGHSFKVNFTLAGAGGFTLAIVAADQTIWLPQSLEQGVAGRTESSSERHFGGSAVTPASSLKPSLPQVCTLHCGTVAADISFLKYTLLFQATLRYPVRSVVMQGMLHTPGIGVGYRDQTFEVPFLSVGRSGPTFTALKSPRSGLRAAV